MSARERPPNRRGAEILDFEFLTAPIEIGRFFKNRKHDIVAVKIKSYEGTVFVDIRQHYQNAAGVNCPTRKGVGITLRKLPELIELLEKAIEKATELGLLSAQP